MSEREMNERDVIQFWDDLVSGRTAFAPTSLDPIESASIRAFQAAAAIPPPETSRQQVTRDVRAAIEKLGQARPRQVATADVRVDGRSRLNGMPADRGPQANPTDQGYDMRRRWSVIPLIAAAALLLVGLGIGYAVFGSGFGDDEPRTTIPAAVETSPSPEPATETVLSLTLAPEELPSGESISSGFAYFTVPVGNRSSWFPYCCPGPMVEYVVEGSYSVIAESPVRVVRADGTTEAIPADTEVTLTAGDALVSRNDTPAEAWNSGTVPVLLISWVHIGDPNFMGHSLPGWLPGDADVRFELDQLVGPATLTIELVPLPDGAGTFAPDPGELVHALPYPEDGFLVQQSDGSVQVGGPPGVVTSAFVFTLTSSAEAASPVAAPARASPVP